MSKLSQLIQNHVGVAKVICGSLLIGFSTVPLTATTAQPLPNSMKRSPTAQAAPRPSARTQPLRNTSIIPPLPEQLQLPGAGAMVTNGKLTVKLVNRTGAAIIYQAIGDTQERVLTGGANSTLQALKTPATITFYRQDRGLLQVVPQASPGLLTVTFAETTDFSLDKNVVTVQATGAVFLN